MPKYSLVLRDLENDDEVLLGEYDLVEYDFQQGEIHERDYGYMRALPVVRHNGQVRLELRAWKGFEKWEDFVERENTFVWPHPSGVRVPTRKD